MKRCKTCKHWVLRPGQIDREWGKCTLAESKDGLPLHVGKLAVAEDEEAYEAHLATRSIYGCVQHEAKEAEEASR